MYQCQECGSYFDYVDVAPTHVEDVDGEVCQMYICELCDEPDYSEVE